MTPPEKVGFGGKIASGRRRIPECYYAIRTRVQRKGSIFTNGGRVGKIRSWGKGIDGKTQEDGGRKRQL